MTLHDFLLEWHNDKSTLLVHTSGSTGTPKNMLVKKQNMLNSAKITCDFLNLKKDDTALLCLPLDFIAGKMMVVRSIERGLKLIYVEPNGHPLYNNSLRESGYSGEITFAAMIPLQVANSLKVPSERKRLMAIKNLIIGGGAIDVNMETILKSFPNAVWSTYGMTETLSHIALRPLSGAAASEWYEPFDSVKLSVDSDNSLIINAPLVCDNILKTNDRVELKQTKQGKTLFRILGRKDNIINSGGIKIQIEEVETILRPYLSAPFVITKKKDKIFGEIVVMLTENNDLDEIRNICKQYLPKFWQPKHIAHLAHIPLTKNGKIARAKAETIAKDI